jgi:hypothetical protein
MNYAIPVLPGLRSRYRILTSNPTGSEPGWNQEQGARLREVRRSLPRGQSPVFVNCVRSLVPRLQQLKPGHCLAGQS